MHPNKGSRAACFAGALTAALLFSAAASSQPTVAPNGPAWKVKPAFEKTDKVREAISGAACALTLPPTCLAVNDEKSYAQFFAIKGRKIVPHRLIRLVPDGTEPGELDIEAVAYDRGFFYVTGSHGAPRNPGAAIDPSRFFIFRFRVNERTGKPRFRFGDEVVDTTAIVKTNALREVIKTTAEIGPFGKTARPERRQHRRHGRQGRQDLSRLSRALRGRTRLHPGGQRKRRLRQRGDEGEGSPPSAWACDGYSRSCRAAKGRECSCSQDP